MGTYRETFWIGSHYDGELMIPTDAEDMSVQTHVRGWDALRYVIGSPKRWRLLPVVMRDWGESTTDKPGAH